MSHIMDMELVVDKESLKEIIEDVELRVHVAMDELTEEVEWTWRKLAAGSEELKSTKSRYLDAIEVTREWDTIVLTLNDELAASLEKGSKPYDLKPGFLRGRTFRVIPLVDKGTNNVTRFRTVTQGSSGWIHPGHEPRNIVEQVTDELSETTLNEVFTRVMSRSKI